MRRSSPPCVCWAGLRAVSYTHLSQDLLDDPDSLASKLNAIINAPGYAERQYFRHYQPGDTLTSADLSVHSGASRSFGSQDSQRLLAAVQEDVYKRQCHFRAAPALCRGGIFAGTAKRQKMLRLFPLYFPCPFRILTVLILFIRSITLKGVLS